VAREERQKPFNDDSAVMGKAEAAIKARHLVEKNNHPIVICFGDRTHDGNLLLALFDEQVRSLCPHKQAVQREAYRNVSDDRGAALGLSLECTTCKEISRLSARLVLIQVITYLFVKHFCIPWDPTQSVCTR
jgi:hypothetical protein